MNKRLALAFICFMCLVISASSQDSMALKKHYPKPKITAFEFLVGPSSSNLRGAADGVTSYAGSGNWYYVTTAKSKIAYSAGVGLTHIFSRHFALYERLLLEQKGLNQKTDSVSLS